MLILVKPAFREFNDLQFIHRVLFRCLVGPIAFVCSQIDGNFQLFANCNNLFAMKENDPLNILPLIVKLVCQQAVPQTKLEL